jgi:hypothetical protein
MSDIGTERLGPTPPVTERVSESPRDQAPPDQAPRNHGSRPRRQPAVPSDPNSEPADRSETPPHQVDSLA